MSDAAITTIVAGVIQIVVIIMGGVGLWLKLKYGQEKTDKKLDNNTVITTQASERAEEASIRAASSTKSAVLAANATATAFDKINSKLNGGVDAAISQAVEPINKMLTEHSNRIELMNTYIHQRNHDILQHLGIQSNRLEAIALMVNQLQEVKNTKPNAN